MEEEQRSVWFKNPLQCETVPPMLGDESDAFSSLCCAHYTFVDTYVLISKICSPAVQ